MNSEDIYEEYANYYADLARNCSMRRLSGMRKNVNII